MSKPARRVRQPSQRRPEPLYTKPNNSGPTPETMAKRKAILGSDSAPGELDDPLAALLARGLISARDMATADAWRRLYAACNGSPHPHARPLTGVKVSGGRLFTPTPSARQQAAYEALTATMAAAVGRDALHRYVMPLLVDRAFPAWLGTGGKEMDIIRKALGNSHG